MATASFIENLYLPLLPDEVHPVAKQWKQNNNNKLTNLTI